MALLAKPSLPEIERLNADTSRKIRFVLGEETANAAYQLHIDASGKIALFEIDSWIDIVQMTQLDGVIGSRFESRRQLIRSLKHNFVESNRNFAVALATSYLVKGKYAISYRNISHFLKEVNRIPMVKLASLPIGYRTFKEFNLFAKVGTVLKNLVGLYV